MRKALLFAVALVLGAPPARAAEPSPAQAALEPPVAVCSAVPAPETPLMLALASTLPACQLYEGNACNFPGAKRRCQWAPFEPGLCVCSSGIWVCG